MRLCPSQKRSVEELKARYYSVWTKIAKARGSRPQSLDVSYRYDASHETRRKEQLLKLASRTFAQIHEESMLSSELKQLQQQRREKEAEKARLAKRAQAKVAADLRAATATTGTAGPKGPRGVQKNPSGGSKHEMGDGGEILCNLGY